MSKVVLHIGTHKTGTTTLQATFDDKREELASAGLVYPDLPNQHHGLVVPWVKVPDVHNYPDGAEANWRSIAKENADSDRLVLISSEELSRFSAGKFAVDFEQIKAWLKPFDEVEVVCMLRDQLSLIQSVFFQVFRPKGGRNWNEFLEGCLAEDQAFGVFLDYGQLYDALLESFSEEEITFLPFRPDGKTVNPTHTLLTYLGFEQLCKSMPDLTANKSDAPLPIFLSALINRPDGIDNGIAGALDDVFGGRRTVIYSANEIKSVSDYFNPKNEAFLARYSGLKPSDLQMAPFLDETYFRRSDFNIGTWSEIARRMLDYERPK